MVFRALQYKNFRLFFTGQGISLIGTWMQQIAMSWLVYRMTGSAWALGLVGFFSQIPTLLVTPFAGVFVDRWNRKKLLFLTQVLSMVQAVVLAGLVLTHRITLAEIFALNFFIGLVNAFDIPVRQSFLIEMIGKKEDLGNAIALNSSMFNMARLIGPALGGILIASFGEGMCFLINAASFLPVVIALSLMSIASAQKKVTTASVYDDLKEGVKYVLGFKPIKAVLLLLCLVSLVGVPYQVLLPIFAKDILGGGSHTLGFLTGMAGAGALTGALFLARRQNVFGLEKIIAWSSGLFGMGMIFFSASKVLWFSLFVIFLGAFGMMVQMASCNTIIQTSIDENIRGRVMSLYALAFIGPVPFGSLLAGSLASRIGAPATLMGAGICCVLAAVVFAKNLPKISPLLRSRYVQNGFIPEGIKDQQLI